MRFPHFDFYVRDWLNDISNRALTREERCVHIDLLAVLWQQPDCMIADNDRIVAAQLGASEEEWQTWRADLVDGPFAVLAVRDGRLYSPRLLKEWEKAVKASESKRQNAAKRWDKHAPSVDDATAYANADASAMQKHMQSESKVDGIHLSSVIYHQDQEATTTERASANPDEPFGAAVEYVLPLFGRLMLKGTEGAQIQTALAQVNHDLPRFRTIVDELAQRATGKIRSFGYFVDRFAEEAADQEARAAPPLSAQGRARRGLVESGDDLLRRLWRENHPEGANP